MLTSHPVRLAKFCASASKRCGKKNSIQRPKTPRRFGPLYTVFLANNGEYIGYAQWTSQAQWEQQRDKSDAELQAHRQAMRECCESIEVLYELEMTDDWLQREVYGGKE